MIPTAILSSILFIGLFSFIIDGIKLLIESNSKIVKRTGSKNKKDLTILFSAYNEQNVLETIETFKNQASKFVIVNDKSSDDTLSKLLTLGKTTNKSNTSSTTNYNLIDGEYSFTIIDNHQNKGKVNSIHAGLELVDTKYVFICDGDIYLDDDFEMPVSLLENEDIDSVCFSILPKTSNNKSIWRNILVGLQLHEYHKSMNIGRQFANNSKSVECISGAAGLFKTPRLKKQSKFHSSEFSGEDLERTLIELFDLGKTTFIDRVIYTDVPETLWSLTKQRVIGWWPGLYRVFPLLFRLIRKKGIEKRLKYEIFYNIISSILDPIKVISLWLLIINTNITILIILYFIYLLFEIYIFFRIKKKNRV